MKNAITRLLHGTRDARFMKSTPPVPASQSSRPETDGFADTVYGFLYWVALLVIVGVILVTGHGVRDTPLF